ncbi:hypothetical protein DFH08DRAFT_662899, partial [Mycena albidolilacea]
LTSVTGKSVTPLANLLLDTNKPLVLGNRSGQVPCPFRGARVDWLDASTSVIPFEVDATINRIYLVAPRILDMLSPMKMFIGFAINVGTKLF